MPPTSTSQWTVEGQNGFESLQFHDSVPIPSLGDHDVLVNIHYASLNYRDLIIPQKESVVPGSDGAGTVLATGARVKEFHAGDKVMTLFNQSHQGGPITTADLDTGVGGVVDGTLRPYAVFEESGLVRMPESVTFQQASTLTCAALTAWNGLYGIEGKALKAGDWVLTQGTGGVSIFALQFAKATGARVIATTSSEAKAKTLASLGADHVINYKTDPQWGATAAKLTGSSGGVHHILEVGGPTTMQQSLRAVRPEGVISIIGFLGGFSKDQPSFLDCLNNICTVRGVLVGSKLQFQDMNAAIDATGIKPVVDSKVFDLRQVKEAYQYMWDQKHFGKLTIRVDDNAGAKL